jgi:cell division septation protein DedD
MGYVVGQNSPRSAKLAAEAASVSSQPAVSDSPRPAPAAQNPQPQTPAQPAEGLQPPPSDAQQPPQPTTQPAGADAAPAAQPPAANGAQPAPAAPASAYPAPPSAPAGSYWQVIAVSQPDIDVFYKTLKDRGFPTWVEPASAKGLMRVLVGPYKDRESMGKAKDEIEKLGFKPIRK